MLEELLRALRNWFACGKATGRIRVEGGALVPPEGLSLAEGQYLRVQGSVFNDGLHRWPCTGLHDEELDGPYQSESFGGYSYTRVMGADGRPLTWRDQFKSRMDPWRKL